MPALSRDWLDLRMGKWYVLSHVSSAHGVPTVHGACPFIQTDLDAIIVKRVSDFQNDWQSIPVEQKPVQRLL